MDNGLNQDLPSSAAHICRLYDVAVGLRQAARFGEAINVFNKAVEEAEEILCRLEREEDFSTCPARNKIKNTLLQICSRAKASIDLLQEINGFVNTDLMNP